MSTPTASPKPKQEAPPRSQGVIRAAVDEVGRWIRYLYFLRFSILLLAFPLVLIWANDPYHARSLVSGILTPETAAQYLCVTFFLIAASFVALMLARIVVINGETRFGDRPPAFLAWLLAHKDARYEWIAPVVFQLSNLYVFRYFFQNGASEEVNSGDIAIGVAAGIVMSFFFWYAVTALYYITYRPSIGAAMAAAMHFGKPTARTLILPRTFLFLTRDGKKTCFGDVLEDADAPLPIGWMARAFPVIGYRWPPHGSLYEGHYFSLLAATGFFALYWVMWPLAAPIPAPMASKIALSLEVIGGILVFALVLLAKPSDTGNAEKLRADTRKLRIWKAILAVPILGFCIPIVYLCQQRDVSRFPILALVLILVISLTWLFGAIAFWADRFRIPVLTTFLVVLIVPRVLYWTHAREEHYLSIAMTSTHTSPPTPAQILDQRIRNERKLAEQEKRPVPVPTFIIVTSTGGGIHAAAWTVSVLQRLEEQFGGHFHDHVLLLSTVSGGSVGLLAYLRELHDAVNQQPYNYARMLPEAECSSLEAVGWGLVYYDIPKAIVPGIPALFAPSPGLDDLKEGPLGKDRTWALRRAFARNLNNPHCKLSPDPGIKVSAENVQTEEAQNPAKNEQFTLSAFSAMGETNPYPAFSMNTTSVENGSRFLLANYKIERPAISTGITPAESFLEVYGDTHPDHSDKSKFPDLPLETAAQLSATFPYVSSAATFPRVTGKQTVHFVDGGYYDNDGTASALEFIRAALDDSTEISAAETGDSSSKKNAAKPRPAPDGEGPSPKIRILLVEIRNSRETNAGNYPLALKPDEHNDCKAWNLGDQLTAPPKAFYAGGHESVTGRNRSILALLRKAYPRLGLRHFVITDNANASDNLSCLPDKNPLTDPLNWALTPAQRNEVARSADQYGSSAGKDHDRYNHIRRCFDNDLTCPLGEEELPQPNGNVK